MCFGRRKSAPPPPPPPPAPVPVPPPPPSPVVTTVAGKTVSPATKAARKAEKRMLALKQGRSSTILTGPRGVLTEADIAKKTLLGA